MKQSAATRAAVWLVSGDTGMSSIAIMARMLGANADQCASYPHDPSDFGRCLQLLGAVPEWRSRMSRMKVCGPAWAALVKRWSDIETSMLEEVGIHWEKARSAPQTYALMKAILAPAERFP